MTEDTKHFPHLKDTLTMDKAKREEMLAQESEKVHKAVRIISLTSLILIIIAIIYLASQGYLTSKQRLEALIQSAGPFAPIVFIIFQIMQTVIPVLLGGVSSGIGVVLFGSQWGFIYNYIGIMIGSVIAFFIARSFGKPVLGAIFSKKMMARYEKYTASDSIFQRYFPVWIFIPIAPDDFICYAAGTTNMTFKRFISILIVGKPIALFLYGEITGRFLTWLMRLF